jgi:hypothetical protein
MHAFFVFKGAVNEWNNILTFSGTCSQFYQV